MNTAEDEAEQVLHDQDAPETLAEAALELGQLGFASPWYLEEIERRMNQAGLTIKTVSLSDLAATIKRDRREWDISEPHPRQASLL